MTRNAPASLGLLVGPALVMLSLALSACPGWRLPAGLDLAVPSPDASGSASPAPRSGGVLLDDPRATPTTYVSPAGGASAVPSPQVTMPGGPFVIDMVVVPNRASIGTRPPAGASPFMTWSVQLKAEVTFSNGLKTSAATWMSYDPSVAAVDRDGVVTAWERPGEVIVVATSKDGQASSSARITILDHAGVGLLID